MDKADHDKSSFGGQQRNAIGYKERECWVCERTKLKKMHVHHIIGKQNPESPLVALCPHCHVIITYLGFRNFLEDAHKVANLITMARFVKGLPDRKTVVKYEET